MLVVQPTSNMCLEECVAKATSSVFLGGDYANVKMPRFQAESTTKLNELLKSMGVDLDKCSMENILVNGLPMSIAELKVKQKAAVKVTEEGTEAAAVTGTLIDTSVGESPSPKHFEMNLNSPFGYAIVENGSNAIIMMGAVRKM